jgi:hypothetical protein
MEKKIEVVTKEGKIIRVMPHMVKDSEKFGVTRTKRTLKDVPKELIKVAKIVEPDPLPVMETTQPVKEVVEKKRKSPVRSKATK